MLAIELANLIYMKEISGDLTNIDIHWLSQDTRKIRENTLFFCIEGVSVDGHQFARKAKEKGAVLFVASKPIEDQIGTTPVIYVKDVTRVMAILANHFYHYHTQHLNMIGVTGTNGKTTVTHMIDYLLREKGQPTALIGTMYRKIGDRQIATRNTTPEILTLHETFEELKQMGGDTCVMEVSSHALQLGRVWGVDYDCVVFTNLTHEHLDLHKTMDHYAHAKSLLFSQLGNMSDDKKRPKVAVLNADEERYEEFRYATPAQIISYGIKQKADFYAKNIEYSDGKTSFDLIVNDKEQYKVTIPLVGLFNVYNTLAALVVAFVNEVDLTVAIHQLEKFPGVDGRMQKIEMGQPYQVIVDFAHTPNGLDSVLTSLSNLPHRAIITVIGHSGGNRDASMRPELGRIALEKSDYVVFTADNPRTEPLKNIFEGLLTHSISDKENYRCIENREQAIEFALSIAKKDDIVLLAGKGSEPYQIIGNVEYPYNEVEVVRTILTKKYDQ